MHIGDICSQDYAVARREDTALHAIKLMRALHAADVIVIEEGADQPIPVGIVTEHDLLYSVVALDLDPSVITVGDIMPSEFVAVTKDANPPQVLQLLHDQHRQRLPVVGNDGVLIGVVAMDDLLIDVARTCGIQIH